jgi:hypothetical protein
MEKDVTFRDGLPINFLSYMGFGKVSDRNCLGNVLLTILFLQGKVLKKYLEKKQAGTHVKISHLVTSLPTSRQQDVFALLVTSCQQVWNNLLTTCNNLVEIIVERLVARLF